MTEGSRCGATLCAPAVVNQAGVASAAPAHACRGRVRSRATPGGVPSRRGVPSKEVRCKALTRAVGLFTLRRTQAGRCRTKRPAGSSGQIAGHSIGAGIPRPGLTRRYAAHTMLGCRALSFVVPRSQLSPHPWLGSENRVTPAFACGCTSSERPGVTVVLSFQPTGPLFVREPRGGP